MIRNLAGNRRSSPSSCCLQVIRFPCAENLSRLVQPLLSPLSCQAEPSTPCKRQRSSDSSTSDFASPSPEPEGMEVKFPVSPPWDPSTRPLGKLSHESSSIGLEGTRPYFLKPIFQSHDGNLEGPSRSELFKKKKKLLVDCASGCADPALLASLRLAWAAH